MPSVTIASGRTRPEDWQQYGGPGGPGIFTEVDTSRYNLPGTPVYLTSLHGTSLHWDTTGATSIYPRPSPLAGFRVYLRHPDGRSLTPSDARVNGWFIRWVATSIDYSYAQ